MRTYMQALLTSALLAGSFAFAGALHADEGSGGHLLYTPDDVDWQEGPASLPAGSSVAILEGHPEEEGPLTMRLRFPADYEIPPHMHPQIEHVTVLSGSFHIGMGEEPDRNASTAVPAGGFVVIPIGQVHYAWASEDTDVQVHSMGPWDIEYVNPENDPRQE